MKIGGTVRGASLTLIKKKYPSKCNYALVAKGLQIISIPVNSMGPVIHITYINVSCLLFKRKVKFHSFAFPALSASHEI